MARKKDRLMEVSDRISQLKAKQAEIDKELASAKQEADELKPLLTCLRCGFAWRARSIEKPPNYCARCHSAGWNRPPRARNSRRPTDQPNPRWLGLAAEPVPEPEPVPAAAPVPEAVPAPVPLKFSPPVFIGLVPPLPLDMTSFFPPLPSLPSLPSVEEEPQPEHTFTPTPEPAPEAEVDDPLAPEPTEGELEL